MADKDQDAERHKMWHEQTEDEDTTEINQRLEKTKDDNQEPEYTKYSPAKDIQMITTAETHHEAMMPTKDVQKPADFNQKTADCSQKEYDNPRGGKNQDQQPKPPKIENVIKPAKLITQRELERMMTPSPTRNPNKSKENQEESPEIPLSHCDTAEVKEKPSPRTTPPIQKTSRGRGKTRLVHQESQERRPRSSERNKEKKRFTSGQCMMCKSAPSQYMIMCDKCEKWAHYECTSLPGYQLTFLLHKRDRKYNCPRCVKTNAVIEEHLQMKEGSLENIRHAYQEIITEKDNQLQKAQDQYEEEVRNHYATSDDLVRTTTAMSEEIYELKDRTLVMETKIIEQEQDIEAKTIRIKEMLKEVKTYRTALTQLEDEAELMTEGSSSLKRKIKILEEENELLKSIRDLTIQAKETPEDQREDKTSPGPIRGTQNQRTPKITSQTVTGSDTQAHPKHLTPQPQATERISPKNTGEPMNEPPKIQRIIELPKNTYPENANQGKTENMTRTEGTPRSTQVDQSDISTEMATQNPPEQGTFWEEIEVPKKKIRYVIGRGGGSTIKKIQVDTETFITSPTDEYPFRIMGTKPQIQKAKDMIEKIIQDAEQLELKVEKDQVKDVLTILTEYVGLVIGPQARRIKDITRETNTEISTPPKGENKFIVIGQARGVERAIEEIIMTIVRRKQGEDAARRQLTKRDPERSPQEAAGGYPRQRSPVRREMAKRDPERSPQGAVGGYPRQRPPARQTQQYSPEGAKGGYPRHRSPPRPAQQYGREIPRSPRRQRKSATESPTKYQRSPPKSTARYTSTKRDTKDITFASRDIRYYPDQETDSEREWRRYRESRES